MEPKETKEPKKGEASGWVCHYHTYIRLHTTRATVAPSAPCGGAGLPRR